MSQVDKIIKTYRTLAQIPALTGARIGGNAKIIKSVWSERNLERGKTSSFQRVHVLSQDFLKLAEIPPVDITTESARCTSKSENLQCIVRSAEDKQFLEIWTKENLSKCVDLKALDVHGEIYTDGEFGSLEFSPDETKVLYIAEKKQPKSEPFLKRKSEKADNKDEGDVVKGQEYVYRQDWGEQLVNKKQSVVVQYDLSTDAVLVLDGIPEGVCPAKPIWGPDGTYVIGIAYKTEPRKLGLIYCTNRLSTIFKLDLEGNYFELNLENMSAKAPKLSLDGRTLIWLQRTAGGPHAACMALVKTELPLTADSTVDTVVDIVQSQIDINNDKIFYGLYNQSFINRCWASNRRLLLSTNQRNTIDSYVIDIDAGSITKLERGSGSLLILDVNNDIVLACYRNYLRNDVLLIGTLPEKDEHTIVWNELTVSVTIDGFQNITYEYLDLEQESDDSVRSFTAIYLGPESGADGSYPLIVWPHGGPHSSFANYLALEAALFTSLGYAVVFVNYRGSTGTGQASIDFLLGRVGASDVADCVLATETVLEKYPWLNRNRIALVGGSHGGFLVTHLSGQHPDMYKAVVARNPVIDIASMSIISDIPDWCYVEAGLEYTQVGEPNIDILLTMRKRSPIMHAHKVIAPTLLQIGSKDLRVPPHQALDYYHRLNANGIPVKLNLYDDNHPLGNVNNEVDNLINTVLWLQENLEK